jgi:importin-9
LLGFFKECAARNTGNFNAIVEQMTAEEIMVLRKIVQQ